MINKLKPVGYIYYNDNTYYAISIERLCDESGNPVGGFGWVAVDCIPTNIEDAENLDIPMIYSAPVFIVGGAFITGLIMPYTIICDIEEGDDIEEDIDETILNNVFA